VNWQPALVLLGLSHRTAPLEVRDRCALAPDEVSSKLEAVRALQGVSEACLLSTCNRTEILICLDGSLGADAERGVETALRELLFQGTPDEHLYVHRGVEAILQLLRVAAGLDSLVLGESQILAQVKEALVRARKLGAVGPLLEALLERALVAGKRVRNETSVGEGTLSVARAGVDLAARVFGRFKKASAVIVGAGETGRLVARHLKADGIGHLCLVNRTQERAVSAAAELGVESAPIEDLPALLRSCDLLAVCVDGAPGLVTPQLFDARTLRRRDRPLVVLDLSVPRAVAPAIADLRNVIANDLDDLLEVVDRNRDGRARAAEQAAPILLAEAHKFLGLRAYASFSPSIVRLRERFDSVREAELDEIAGEHATPEMVRLAHKLTKHLLDVSLETLKESARSAVPTDPLDQAYQKFLEDE